MGRFFPLYWGVLLSLVQHSQSFSSTYTSIERLTASDSINFDTQPIFLSLRFNNCYSICEAVVRAAET